MDSADQRPDPDQLLSQVQGEAAKQRRGRLEVFLGACPGVGKTYAMLSAAQRLRAQGVDVVVGVVETHGRKETATLLRGLEVLPRRVVEYRGARLEEFDVDAALLRKPAVLLVDELAHTNAAGARFAKRWQDVRALLEARIDVHTTLNVQHIESLNDVVARLTGVTVRETVPDAVLDEADEVEVVDLAPDALLERLRAGKVYVPDSAEAALQSFFRKGNVAALRELALRKTAQLVDQRRREDRQVGGTRRVRSANERVLVGVGPSPSSARLVRAAHRMTAVVRGELFAVHVAPAPPRRLTEADHQRVLQHLRIAESLGARVASIQGDDAAAALVAFARDHDISRIVVGKTRHSRLHDLLHGSFTMDVIRGSGDVDVYVIDDGNDAEAPVRVTSPVTAPEPRSPRRFSWRAQAAALPWTAAALTTAWLLYDPPDLSAEALVLMLGVVVVAQRHGRWPAVVASLLSALAFNFLLIEPRFTFAVTEPSYLFAFGAMLVVGITVASLVARVRESADSARGREAEVTALHSHVRELADAESVEDVGRMTIAHLRDVLPADLVMLAAKPGAGLDRTAVVATHGDNDWLGGDELAVARWCQDHGVPAGLGTNNLPGTQALFVPLRSSRGAEGVIGIRPRPPHGPPDTKQRLLIDTFAQQAASRFERLVLAEERHRVQREAETERLRSNLLASVSHDLRTPLATITGSASSLLYEPGLGDSARHELLLGINTEASRLNELIGNLLFATRLDRGEVLLKCEWTSIEEVVGTALRRAAPALAGHRVHVAIDELPLLRADAILLEQAVYLVLDNAARHTPAGTEVTVRGRQLDAQVVLDIADNGPGIPAIEHERVFQRFERGRRSSGMGLGLSICAAIMQAHGGSARLVSSRDPGTIFRLALPLPREAPPAACESDLDHQELDHQDLDG